MPTPIITYDTTTGADNALSSAVNAYVPTWDQASGSWSSLAQQSLLNGTPYQIATSVPGVPAPNEVMLRFVAERTIQLSTNSVDHKFFCRYPPTINPVTVTIFKKDNDFGVLTTFATVTYNILSVVGSPSGNGLYPGVVGSITTDNILSPGDLLYVKVGSTADSTFSTPSFSISGFVTTTIYGGAIYTTELIVTAATNIDLSGSTFFNVEGTYELIHAAIPISTNWQLITVTHSGFPNISTTVSGVSFLVTLALA
jgi:hypothetical protein